MSEHLFVVMEVDYKIKNIPDDTSKKTKNDLVELITNLIEQDFNSFSTIKEFDYNNLVETFQYCP